MAPATPTAAGRPDGRGYFPENSVLRRVHAERAVGLNYGQRALMIGAAPNAPSESSS